MDTKPILFEDLIAYRTIEDGLSRLTNVVNKFGDTATQQNDRFASSIGGLKSELSGFIDLMKGVDTANKNAADTLRKVKTDSDSATDGLKAYERAAKRNQQAIDANAASIVAIKKRLADLKLEYDNLDRSEAKNVARQKEIISETKQLSVIVNAQTKITREATRAIDTAEKSYDRLNRQTIELRAQLRGMSGAFDENTGKINKNNRAAVELQAQIEKNDKALKQMDSTMGVHTRNVGNYGSAFKDLAGQLTGVTSVAAAIALAFQAIKAGVGIIEDMNRYDLALKAVSRDSADFARTQQFLMGLSDKLGLRYGNLVDSYKNLKAATKDTRLEGRATEQIFQAVATAGAKLQLSNETITGTLTALVQMISKGHIQAEELRGQLGERLPGALKLMAEALGVSETKLNKMMEQGELIATEVMPKFAKSLDKAYGLEQNQKIESLTASANRFKNEVDQTVQAFGNSVGINNFFKAIIDGFGHSLRALRLFVKDGSWTEFITFVGAGSFSNRTAFRMRAEDASTSFAGMDSKARKAELDRLAKQEVEQRKKGETDAANETQALRRRLRAENLKLELAEIKEGRRKVAADEKDAIEKNEADIARFQKQSLRKRTAEILALEKQLKANPNDTDAQTKLELYKRLDAEQRANEKAVKDRMDSYKPEKSISELERLDKEINKIVELLETQAMKDLKAGRVITVDPVLVAKVEALRKEYKQIKDLKESIENGTYGKSAIAGMNIQPLSSTGTTNFGRTDKKGQLLNDEQIKADDAKRLAEQVNNLQKQADIFSRYSNERKRLLHDYNTDYNGFTKAQKDILLSLLDQQLEAERQGKNDRVQLIKDEIRQRKELYREDLANRRELTQKSIEIGVTLVNGLFEIESQKNQNRLDDLQKQQDAEMSMYEGNESAKAEIQKKYDAQRKQIQRQQDIQARTQALFNIAVNTAQAVVGALAKTPLPAGLPLALATGALGAVQAGIVLARPLPEYYTGKNFESVTKDNYEGPALLGDRYGRELWIHNGEAEIVDQPSIKNVGKDDIIFPNHITERLLSDNRAFEASDILGRIALSRQANTDLTTKQAKHKAMYSGGPSADHIGQAVARALEDNPTWSLSMDERGFNLYGRHKSTLRKIQDNKHQLGRKRNS